MGNRFEELALAGAIVHPKVKERAVNMGFYVAVQSGDTMTIDMPESFKPKRGKER